MSEPAARRKLLEGLFAAALAAADPRQVLTAHLPEPPRGRTLVVGAGKGAAAMALAVERAWQGPLSGLVVTRYGHALACRSIEVVEASHPVPDRAGEVAAEKILALVRELGADDLLLCLISGGGSALLALPAPGLTLADKQSVNRALLASGASISEINCVRKHLSAIKGGRLAAAAAPARVVTLAISDVPGDDPATIASGPSVADPSTFAQARAILAKYDIEPPSSVRRHLERAEEETPKPGDPRLARSDFHLVARPQDALEAAAEAARQQGLAALILGDSLEGEAREVGRVMAGIALQVRRHRQPLEPPCILLSGGETTVTLRPNRKDGGRGGRNTEFLLALGVALQGARDGDVAGISAIACDTDGIDGSEENAGAVLLPGNLARAAERGLDAKSFLARNDSYSFFAGLGDLVVTGPTLTNVNDFRAILIE